MRQRTSAIVVALASVTLLAACTSVSPGNAEPASRTTATSDPESRSTEAPTSAEPAEELPSDGAPKVANPLDTSRFQADPCLSLSATQLQELNLPVQGKPNDETLGKSCEWRNSDTGGQVLVAFLDGNLRGLSAAYKANEAGKFAYFLELREIEGYPAIASDRVDDRQRGTCPVSVGVTDKLVFDVALTLSRANVGKKEPCEVAVQVAGMALRTMKAGG